MGNFAYQMKLYLMDLELGKVILYHISHIPWVGWNSSGVKMQMNFDQRDGLMKLELFNHKVLSSSQPFRLAYYENFDNM